MLPKASYLCILFDKEEILYSICNAGKKVKRQTRHLALLEEYSFKLYKKVYRCLSDQNNKILWNYSGSFIGR
jgi:hypothetical protein